MNYITPQIYFDRNSQFLSRQRVLADIDQSDRIRMNDWSILIRRFRDIGQEDWHEKWLKEAYSDVIREMLTRWETEQDFPKDREKECKSAIQQLLRKSLMGGRPGPVLMVTMELLGRDECLRRFEFTISNLRLAMTEEELNSMSSKDEPLQP